MRLLQSILEDGARRLPDKTALVCGAARTSYAALEAQANRLARLLANEGVERGDRVLVCLDNSTEAVVAFFAVLKADAVVVPVNPTTKAEKLHRLVADCAAKLVVTTEAKRAQLGVVGAATLTLPCDERLAGLSPARPDARNIDLDLACLIYTSGTTGQPKGVMHAHQGLLSVTRSIAGYLGSRDDDVVLSVLPLSFGYGLTQLWPTFLVGGTLVLEKSFAFPQVTLQKMAAERVTGFAMVPTIAVTLLKNDLTRFDLSALRTLTNAGAGIPPAVLGELRQKLPHVRLFPMYGQTECIRASFLPPEEVDVRPAAIGKGIPGSELWLADDDGRRLPPGSVGELVVRGANVMRGYWNLPEATAQKLRPGPVPGEHVLFTGDLFSQDEDGWLRFVSRKDDIIKTRGEKVSPREVEDVLHACPGIAEAVVLGVADAVLGESVRAFVVLREGAALDEKAVLRFCAEHVEDYAVPKRAVILQELPKTPNAKIDRTALRDLVQADAKERT
ncbi:MAG: AMP-binding protein [Deltaproteobacteria bacterium]|nr:AMP-binding protein [Deltaproteobacteria bacterium]